MGNNLHEDIEMIVNNESRQREISERYRRSRKKKMAKKIMDAFYCACLACMFSVLGKYGLVHEFIAVFFVSIFTVSSIFNIGRWYEHGKLVGFR